MSQPSRMSNGTDPTTCDDETQYTLVANTHAQTIPQHLITPALATDAKAAVAQATATLSALSTSQADSSRLLVESATSFSTQEASPNSQQLQAEVHGGDPPEPSGTTEPDASATLESSHTEEHTAHHATKRDRADSEDHDTSPAPKKVTMEFGLMAETSIAESPAKPEESTKLDTNGDNQDVSEDIEAPTKQGTQGATVPVETAPNDDQDELPEPEGSTEASKAERKPAPKRSNVAAGRRRACDTCRRRKVKCKHDLPEEEAYVNPHQAKKANITKSSAANETKEKKPVQTNKQDKSVQVSSKDDDGEETEETPITKAKARKAPVAPKKAVAPPERTSTRHRKAPERLADIQEPAAIASVKKSTSKVFDPVYITTNSTSRLGKADMHKALLDTTSWTSLSAEQQVRLIAMLPDTAEHQQLLARIKAGDTGNTRPEAFTLSNDCFRTDVAKFQEDLKNGHLAKTWQAVAEQAVIERAAGEYDAWKAEEAELWWGQKSK